MLDLAMVVQEDTIIIPMMLHLNLKQKNLKQQRFLVRYECVNKFDFTTKMIKIILFCGEYLAIQDHPSCVTNSQAFTYING